MNTADDFTDANHLLAGFNRAKRASGWKTKTQKYGLNILPNIRKLQNELRDGAYQPERETTFTIYEMGKKRTIRAPTVRDIVMQQSLVNTALIPSLRPYLIHDNGASLKGKGISFTRRRFEQHLAWHYRRYGTDGYVLKLDFRHYFDSIDHDKLCWELRRHIDDEQVLQILRACLQSSDDGNGRSIGIGSVISQIVGIYFPTRVDTYCKTVRRVHCYDAYMDDRIILHPDKDFLAGLLRDVQEIADGLGLKLHPRKTQIIKLSRGFTFLKTRYMLTDTGKILRGIPKDVVTRERRKLKKLARFVASGDMSLESFAEQYASWRGSKTGYDAHFTLRNIDIIYKELITWLKQNSQKKKSAQKRKNSGRRDRKSSTIGAT